MEKTENVVTIEEPAPKPFKEVPGLWFRFGRMSEDFFANELPYASTGSTFKSVVILALIMMPLMFFPVTKNLSPYETSAFSTTQFFSFLLLIFLGLVVIPLQFYFSNWTTFISAKILGGNGSYYIQAYLISLVWVPCYVLIALSLYLTFIPIVGNFLAGLIIVTIALYQFVLSIIINRVTHQLPLGRSILSVILGNILFNIILVLIS
jgi:hypothetical protein